MDRTYPHGATSWIDLATPDVAASTAFYGELFGWTFEDRLPPGEQRYVIAGLDGQDAAGAGGPGEAGEPAFWNTYIAVDDADETTRALVERGAAVLAAPQDAGPAGRSATLRDPQGAVFSLWQAGYRLGAQAVRRPGAWSSSDLHTGDVEAARAFYGGALGWSFDDAGRGATSFSVPGHGDQGDHGDAVGSLVPLAADEPARWEVTFTVADLDDAAQRVERLGGTVKNRTEDDGVRRADVRDPQGALLVISQRAPRGDQQPPSGGC